MQAPDIESRIFPFPAKDFLSVGDLDRSMAERLLDLADAFADWNGRPHEPFSALRGLTVANLFFENSTRTRSSFEIAAKRLGADVVNLDVATSSSAKGESLLDTSRTLDAMRSDLMVVRHAADGAPADVAKIVQAGVVNAGDGRNEHPTQGLLDALTIRRAFGRIEGLTVAICGDVRHSRVAGSNLKLLPMLGARVRLVAPAALMRAGDDAAERFDDFKAGIAGADVVMMLRLQKERMEQALIPSSEAYFRDWGLDREKLKLAAPNARVMHPGPMNREVEIASDVADDASVSLIRAQVANGVAARMAVLACLAAGRTQG